ncbi:hypothetical protein FHS57_004101 [Runella defluvii]|uniref:Lipoprotein n=1 Tax=Runella defluvii TaxID=370973 RepID=A0A7W6ERZ5_9BACT|nr:hypothetical protein [Runella defluvii]MBB3840088.1 hypothetical protein [Runella defluvii]
MKTRFTLLATFLVLATVLSSCFYSGGYRSRYYDPYYAPRPYVRVVPPPPAYRPRVYVAPPRYRPPHRYESRGRYQYHRGNRRRW